MAPPDPAALIDPTKKKPRSLDEILSSLDSTGPDGKSARSLDDILKTLGDTGPPERTVERPAAGVATDTGDVDLDARQQPARRGFFDRAAEFMGKDRAPATRQALEELGGAVKQGVLHPIDTAQSLLETTAQPLVSAARPLKQEQTTPEAPRAFGSATTGAPEPFELEQRALDPGITGKEKLIGAAGTVGMIIAGPMEGKMANALVTRWGGEVAAAAIRTMGVRRAYQLGIVNGVDIAQNIAAHGIASSVAGAEAGAMMNPEESVKGALAGAVAGPILRAGGAVARGASRELGIGARGAAERIRARREAVPPRTAPETNPDRLLGTYPERPARPAATATTPPAPESVEPDYTTEPVDESALPERREAPRAEGDVWTPEKRASYVAQRQGAFTRRINKPWSQWTQAEKDAYFADIEDAKQETKSGAPPATTAPPAASSPEVVRVRTADIYRDPERFQFKQGLGEEGVSRELKSTQKYNPQLAGVIGTWIDPANGKEYVVNGHHRDELAKRTGYPYQNAMRIQAKTPEEARSIGALMNIAEGRGTPIDVAKFLRDTKLDTGELEKQGISLRGDLARKGLAISKLAPDVFAKVASEEVPIGHAVQLGEMLPDQPELQRETLKAISSSGQRLTESEVKEVARQVRDAGSETVNQDTLFGNEAETKPLYVERGRVAASLLKKLSTDRRVLGFVAAKGRPEVLSKAGNKIDVERSKALADQSSQLEEVFQRLYTRGGPIANLLTDAARKVASGQNLRSVSDELYPAVTEAIRQAIPGSGKPPGAHGAVPQSEETLAPGAPAEEPSDEVKPYTSSDEAQGGMFERPPRYGDNPYRAAIRALWDRSGPNGRLELLKKWRRLHPADEFHRGRTFPPSLARLDIEDLPDHVQEALGIERAEEVAAMGGLGVREQRPIYGKGHEVQGAEHLWSALGRRIEAAPFEKGTSEQWAAHLKTGVSAGEREFTGIDDFLKQNAGKVIKKERMQQEFDQRRIRLAETKLPSRALTTGEWTPEELDQIRTGALEALRRNDNLGFDTTQQAMSAVAANVNDFSSRWEFDTQTDIDAVRKYARVVNTQLSPSQRAQPAQYEQYKEPGGKNYREILVQLNRSDVSNEPDKLTWVRRGREGNYDWVPHSDRMGSLMSRYYIGQRPNGQFFLAPGTGGVGQDYDSLEAAQGAAQRLHDRDEIAAAPGAFASGHFQGRPNILGHLRIDDREYNGEKVLFAEEFQSDWHQKGRKHGYKKRTETLRKEDIRIKRVETGEQLEGIGGTAYWEATTPTGGLIARLPGYMTEAEVLHNAYVLGERERVTNPLAVPDAPFKKTEEWLGLLMKRLINEAVNGGYDRIAWTNGDQQASRYDLSKQVDRLTWDPQTNQLEAWKGSDKLHQGHYDPRALDDVIGKEAAEKLLAPEALRGSLHVLEGQSLKIGGEGMKAFYDKIAPKVAQSIGKELGVPVSIERVPIITAGDVAKRFHVFEENAEEPVASFNTRAEAVRWRDENLGDAAVVVDNADLVGDDAPSRLTAADVRELADDHTVKRDTRELLEAIATEMSDEADNWSDIVDIMESSERHDHWDRETWRAAITILRDADYVKLAELAGKAGGQPSFKITPELKAAAGKGMRMMEGAPDLFGAKTGPEQQSLLPEGAGRSVPQRTAGGFTAKQREAKEKADFLRKQLPRITDPEKRARVASEIASLDRIANFAEKVKPPELAARAEAEKPIEGKPDTGTIDLFAERRARTSRDPLQQHLELTFGSVEKAKAVVDDLVKNAGQYVTSSFMKEAISAADRLTNLKLWESRDSLFQAEAKGQTREETAAWVTIKGKTARRSRDVAQLLHAFRSPRTERLHFLLLDDNDVILDHQIDTSGAINYVQFQPTYAQRIYDAAKAVGATKVVLAHNHPSGNPHPSEDDRRMTAMMQQELNGLGLELREHVIIDHRKFSQLVSRPRRDSDTGETTGSTVEQTLEIPVTPEYENDWTHGQGMRLNEPRDVALMVRRSSPLSKGFAVIYMNSQHEAVALEPHHAAGLRDIEKWLPARIRDLGAFDVIVVHEKGLTEKIPGPNGNQIDQQLKHYLQSKAELNPALGRVLIDVMAFDGTDAASQVYGSPISGHAVWNEAEPVPARRILENGVTDENAENNERVPAARARGDVARSHSYGALPPADFRGRTLPRVGEPPPPAGGQPPGKPPKKGRAVAKLPDEEPQGGVFGSIRKSLAPAGRTGQSAITARALRESNARLARQNELAVEKLKKYRKAMNRLTIPERYDWIDAVETGQLHRIKDPELRTAAQLVRTLLDNARDDVIGLGTGKLENWIENYFPHIWKNGDPSIIGRILGRRPFEGPKSFLKSRTIPTTKEGLAQGLEPVTDNPFDLALLRLREMNRYVAAHRFISELKDRGLVQFVKAGTLPPEGYQQIDDKIGTVFGKASVALPNNQGTVHLGGILIRGAYWGPEPVVTVINNYLAPGLRGNPLYDAYAGIGNVLNQSQLGISAFHLGFTTADATISNMALAIEQLAAGQFRQGAFRLLTTPAAPFTTFLKGHKMYAEYFNPQNNAMAALMDAVTAGGGRVRMDSFYRTNYLSKFLEDLKHNDPKALLHFYPAFLELVSKPILEWIVPRQKLGVFAQLVEFEMSRLPKGASRDDLRRVMAEAWDAVDNRMGQLVYDNLFWKRTLKDAAMGSFRSVGWNIGTFKTVGTGFLDIGKIAYGTGKFVAGKGPPPKMSRDLAYVMGLTFFVIVADSILNYLMTGKHGKGFAEWERTGRPHGRDFFAPETGTKNDEGNPDRVVLPTYMKDIIGYSQHPWETVKHKLNPAIEAVNEMLENKDFYGVQIRNPDDPIMKQLKQEMTFFLHLIEPFGVRNAQEQKRRGQGLGVRAANYVGVTPANRAMTRTAAQNKIMEFVGMESPQMTTPEQKAAQQARHDLRGAKAAHRPLGEVKAEARDAGLSRKQIEKTVKELPTGDIWLDRFKRLQYPQMTIVFGLANEDEQRRFRFQLVKKRRAYEREHGHQATR